MKYINYSIVLASCIALTACDFRNSNSTSDQATYQCISTKLSIANKDVDSVVEWNTKTGEARLLNAASFADKATGQQGNLIGWVPLVDLQQAVQNLASQIQAQQKSSSSQPTASPTSTPIKPSKN